MDRLKVIIAEDEGTMSTLFERIIRPLLEQIPGSSSLVVRSLKDVQDLVKQVPPFDLCILDLTLNDSSYDGTLSQIESIERYCPVLVLSGHIATPEVTTYSATHRIVYKQEDLPAKLPSAIVQTIEEWHDRKHKEHVDRIRRLKDYAERK